MFKLMNATMKKKLGTSPFQTVFPTLFSIIVVTSLSSCKQNAPKNDFVSVLTQIMVEEPGITTALNQKLQMDRGIHRDEQLERDIKLLLNSFSGKLTPSQHQVALQRLDSLLKSNMDFVKANASEFFVTRGLHELYLGQIELAEKDFDLARADFPEQVAWYRTLAIASAQGPGITLKNALEAIASEEHPHQADAQLLLEAMLKE